MVDSTLSDKINRKKKRRKKLGWLGKHRLNWDSRCKVTMSFQIINSDLQKKKKLMAVGKKDKERERERETQRERKNLQKFGNNQGIVRKLKIHHF